jgi:hypothetical protein
LPGNEGDGGLRDAKAIDAALDTGKTDGRTDAAADDARDVSADAPAGNPVDATIVDAGRDVGVVGAADTGIMEAAGPSSGGIRVANWSSDAPAVDFCLAPAGSNAFQGPMMKAKAQALDGGSTTPDGGIVGLPFPQVSSYSLVAAGQYDVRVVVALAADCSVSVVGDATRLPPSSSSTPITVALVGTGALRKLLIFADETGPAKSTNLALRFIHAASGIGPVSFGTGDVTSGFKALFSGVPFQASGTLPDGGTTAPTLPDGGSGPAADANGYLQRSPLTSTTLSAQLTGITDDSGAATQLASTSSFSAAAGAVITFALVGTQGAPQLLRCLDNAGVTPSAANPFGLYASCVIAPP